MSANARSPVSIAKEEWATKQGDPTTRVSCVFDQVDRLLKRRFSEVLAVHGLTLPQFTALSVINARGAITNAKLAACLFITRQSANEVVKTMEANGWVGRTDHPTHGRLIDLYLTQNGRSPAAQMRCND